MRATTRLRLLALLALLAITAAACGGGGTGDEETEDDTGSPAEATDGEDTEATEDAEEPTEEATTEGTEGTEAAEEPDAGGDGVLVYGSVNNPASIDPAKCYDSACGVILDNVTDTLVAVPAGGDTVEPSLAENVEVSDDGLTYTFTLREGVTFHDGSDLTSEDVAFSLQRSIDINHPEGASFLIGSIESIETPDDLTVEITIAEANSTFLARLNYTVAAILPSDGPYTTPDAPIVPSTEDEGAAALADADSFIYEDSVVSTGPYMVTDYAPGESVTLEANPNYWGEAPAIGEVRLQYFEDGTQLANAMAAGEVDLVVNDFGPSEAQAVEAEGITVTEAAGGRIRYLVVDVNAPPYDNADVRRAIAATIDRERIIDEVFEGRGEPLYSMIPSAFEVNEDFISDIEVPELEGTPIPIELWYPLNRYGDTEPDVAETIARSLNESGLFEVTTQGADWAAEYSANLDTGAYSLFLLGWYPDFIDPDNYIEPFYHTEGFLGYYSTPEMDELITAEQQATDPAERNEIFTQIQELAAADMPLIPLYEEGTTAYTSERVAGVEATLDAAQKVRFYVMSLTE